MLIGKTEQDEERMKTLDTTSKPFECFYAARVEDIDVERHSKCFAEGVFENGHP